MLANYIDKAMEQAVYEIIKAEGTYWGEIPALQACGRATRRSKAAGANFGKR